MRAGRTFPELVGGPRDEEAVPILPADIYRRGVFVIATLSDSLITPDRGELPTPNRVGYREHMYTKRKIAFAGSDTVLDVWVDSTILDGDMSDTFWNRLLDRAGCKESPRDPVD